MQSGSNRTINNQRGSVINVALLILILIFLVGIGLHKISTTDVKIASNMKTQATTFYEAEAGLEAASELLELNVACSLGFYPGSGNAWDAIEETIMVTNKTFWRNTTVGIPAGNPDESDKASLPPEIDAYYPITYDPNNPTGDPKHTNISFGGDVRFASGSAIQMAAGYEGLGKGAAAGGASIIYDINVMRYGDDGSKALHTIQWIHKLDSGETCQYRK